MKESDFTLMHFEPPFVEGCEIKCPQCEQFSLHAEFKETEIGGCELCGEHAAMICPKCGRVTDLVHTYSLETRSMK